MQFGVTFVDTTPDGVDRLLRILFVWGTIARQQEYLVEQHATGEHTIADLAEIFSVSRATVYRVLERARVDS